MKNKEVFDRSVNSLVQSYLNDTLEAYECKSCAVGNIVAGVLSLKLVRANATIKQENFIKDYPNNDAGLWYKKRKVFTWWNVKKKAAQQISLTGYTEAEIFEIEKVFMLEWSRSLYEKEFTALLAVYELLLKIHDVKEGEAEKGKVVFSKRNHHHQEF